MESKKKEKKAGFTLVEMLVVIVVVIVLMSIVFKLNGKAADSANRAKTVHNLEKLSAALAEFQAQYGVYPPWTGKPEEGMLYEIVNSKGFDPSILEDIRRDYQNDGPPSLGLSFYFSKISFGGVHTNLHIPMPSAEDLQFLDVILPYVEGVIETDEYPTRTTSSKIMTNTIYYARDGWGNNLNYSCKPPYRSYRLFSNGPDGKPDTKDDISNNMGDL